jgi:lipopolysaccharide transport system ATP-binding protein
MSDLAIRVDGIGKRYRIRQSERYLALRDVLTEAGAKPFRWLRSSVLRQNGAGASFPAPALDHSSNGNGKNNGSAFAWALDDVSFEVKQGEVVGIIGRNGAGKSTLLKILSRITRPTRGHAEIHGRVGSLLEVGTGFHPELSGRENIFLNGAVLGMRRAEIKRKFDAIVAFAEVEKFIDMPVKRYSSGMQVRLAFAVAAHLEPEILLVDEVLAVGDAEFQKKCLGKMDDVAAQGRTVLFVSHHMPSVVRLSPRTMLLDRGRIVSLGQTDEVVGVYLNSGIGLQAEQRWSDESSAPGDELVRLNLVRVCSKSGESQQLFDSREPLGIVIGYNVFHPIAKLAAEFVIHDSQGTLLFTSANQYDDRLLELHQPGSYLSTCWIPGNLMTEGTFFLRVSIVEIQVPIKVHVFEENILAFQISDPMRNDSARGRIAHSYPGVIRPRLEWETTYCEGVPNKGADDRNEFSHQASAGT